MMPYTLASEGPPTLVGLPTASTTTWLDLVSRFGPLALAVVFGVLALWIGVRLMPALLAGRGSEFASATRGLGLSNAEKKLLRELAAQEGAPSAVTLMLVPSAFIREAARAGRTVQAAPMLAKLFV